MSEPDPFQDKVFFSFDSGATMLIPCTTDIAPGHTAQSTDSPVELGSDVSDHIRVDPDTLSLTLFLSEMDGQTDEFYDPDFVGDHIKMREALIARQKARDLVSIDLGPDKGIYANMFLTSVSPIWNSGEGKSPTITLALKELRYATTKTRKIAPRQRAALLGGAAAGVGDKPALFAQGESSTDAGFQIPTALTPGNAGTGGGRLDTQITSLSRASGLPADWARP